MLASIAVHTIIVFFGTPTYQTLRPIAKTQSKKIRVKVQTLKEKRQQKIQRDLQPKKPLTNELTQNKKHATDKKKSRIKKDSNAYSKWLPDGPFTEKKPKKSLTENTKKSFERLSTKDKEKVTLMRESLAFSIDIPVTLRDLLPNGKARFSLYKTSKGYKYSLSGDPYLKAFLQKTLFGASKQKEVIKLIEALGLQKFRILFHLENKVSTRLENRDGLPYRQTNQFVEQGLRINVIRFVGGTMQGSTGGFQLPDEEAEKRRKWEKKDILELKDFPAFRRNIRRENFQ